MGSPKKDKVFFGGIISGLPKMFFEEKDFWEKGEKALSCQSHGVALTAFELGNGALYAPFPDRARALPRETAGVVSVAVAVKQLPAKCAPIGPTKKDKVFFWGIISGLPQRFCVSKRFVGKGGTSAPNVVFAVRQTPEKSAL